MQIAPLEIPEVLVLTPRKFEDERGFFSETYRQDALSEAGILQRFVQDNHAFSSQSGVLRGLHFQIGANAQGKLVRCARGAILDVAVDIRTGSPTFGKHVASEISASNWRQIWVPPGFAHGYVTLEPDCEVLYKTTAYYDPAAERGIAWNDPALNIDWRLRASQIILSAKDTHNPTLAEAELTST